MSAYNTVLGIEVKISDKNIKMGNVPSVSLPPVISCSNCQECSKYCYAKRMVARYPNTKTAYETNWNLWKTNPSKYFQDLGKVIVNCDKFRWHVAGDIPNLDYLEGMVKLARKNKHCQMLCFTKNYEIVNVWLQTHRMPRNLHMIFSVWDNTPYTNPHNLPTAHVLYRDGHTTAKNPTHLCDGNCASCFIHKKGCLKLKKGESVVFKQH